MLNIRQLEIKIQSSNLVIEEAKKKYEQAEDEKDFYTMAFYQSVIDMHTEKIKNCQELMNKL